MPLGDPAPGALSRHHVFILDRQVVFLGALGPLAFVE